MCIRDSNTAVGMFTERDVVRAIAEHGAAGVNLKISQLISVCLLYTSDAADERSSVDLGGRRIIKKKTNDDIQANSLIHINN